MVTMLKGRHRVLRKGSKISNKDGAWTSSVLSYEQRRRHFELTTLTERRIRGDLIETFKIMTGKERVDRSQFFQLYLWVAVKRSYHEAVEATNQSWCPEILIQPACCSGMAQIISRCWGSYVCEPVQEQTGQVLAKIWALKAWLN